MLVKSKNLPPYLQDVYVEGITTRIHDGSDSSEEENSHRSSEEDDDKEEDSDEQGGHHRLHELKIRVYNHTVEFKNKLRVVVSTGRGFFLMLPPLPPFSLFMGKGHISKCDLKKLKWVLFPSLGLSMCMWLHGLLHHGQTKSIVFSQVDGRHVIPPVSPSAGLKIYKRFLHVYLKSDFGLLVRFNKYGATGKLMWIVQQCRFQSLHLAACFLSTEIILPHVYRRKLGGMCGNFDQQRQNDWMKPDGTLARNVREFGESWRVWTCTNVQKKVPIHRFSDLSWHAKLYNVNFMKNDPSHWPCLTMYLFLKLLKPCVFSIVITPLKLCGFFCNVTIMLTGKSNSQVRFYCQTTVCSTKAGTNWKRCSDVFLTAGGDNGDIFK